ncbi:fused MFS/spermidine synthase [Glutamicibacter sp.]|uniref:spermidine synthase n=1 Tax=Glutamicibacter sp. TaxID=1931995 RepID=UPI0028BF3CD2|nr:fused MFS/spermidine synthase [Glutamicibacter sp.]
MVSHSKILAIGGAEQSHVNLAQPQEVFYEYLARIANHIKVLKPTGAPLRMLHLGAGALTLARWASVVYPQATHVAVDIERELLNFVLSELPLPANCVLTPVVADAREVFDQELFGEKFDVIIVDIFSGPEAPEHLTAPAYYAELRKALEPEGLLFVNIGDDPPLKFTGSQIQAAQQHFNFVMLSAPPQMFTRKYPGNLILTAAQQPLDPSLISACEAAGPFPSEVRFSVELDGFGKP